eukprot:CAMPEP_0179027194 /NCGR_PEP_ID=MMETSP0796-20121207/8913_1 /TAXON_ID=73915 /ORGANISM="Pyrodinium bahamense, Strain pbaha01" /LENGTH=707 /DNA_ID=CAMNT_0020723315 /DNA_START=1 /DNA_END=2127 /DNA_ORIENTATION=+
MDDHGGYLRVHPLPALTDWPRDASAARELVEPAGEEAAAPAPERCARSPRRALGAALAAVALALLGAAWVSTGPLARRRAPSMKISGASPTWPRLTMLEFLGQLRSGHGELDGQDQLQRMLWTVVWPGGVNIRSGPSTDDAMLGTKAAGAHVRGRQIGDWLELREGGYMLVKGGNTIYMKLVEGSTATQAVTTTSKSQVATTTVTTTTATAVPRVTVEVATTTTATTATTVTTTTTEVTTRTAVIMPPREGMKGIVTGINDLADPHKALAFASDACAPMAAAIGGRALLDKGWGQVPLDGDCRCAGGSSGQVPGAEEAPGYSGGDRQDQQLMPAAFAVRCARAGRGRHDLSNDGRDHQQHDHSGGPGSHVEGDAGEAVGCSGAPKRAEGHEACRAHPEGHDNPGHDNPGHDNPGHENPGHDNPGHDNPGHDNPGQDNPGHDSPDDPSIDATNAESAGYFGEGQGGLFQQYRVTLFCFAVMLPWGGEIFLLQQQFTVGANMFGCDQYSIYSSEVINVAPGVQTVIARNDLKCTTGGEFKTALNTDIFIDIWKKVVAEGKHLMTDWTVKVDPDTVFFPARLRQVLAPLQARAAGAIRGMYLNNCKFGMHGPMEVLSRTAVGMWFSGIDRCIGFFKGLCSGKCLWGEDMFMDQCFRRQLAIERINNYDVLREDHCNPPPGWNTCRNRSTVAFHPFKAVAPYEACLTAALL